MRVWEGKLPVQFDTRTPKTRQYLEIYVLAQRILLRPAGNAPAPHAVKLFAQVN